MRHVEEFVCIASILILRVLWHSNEQQQMLESWNRKSEIHIAIMSLNGIKRFK